MPAPIPAPTAAPTSRLAGRSGRRPPPTAPHPAPLAVVCRSSSTWILPSERRLTSTSPSTLIEPLSASCLMRPSLLGRVRDRRTPRCRDRLVRRYQLTSCTPSLRWPTRRPASFLSSRSADDTNATTETIGPSSATTADTPTLTTRPLTRDRELSRNPDPESSAGSRALRGRTARRSRRLRTCS